MKLGIWTKGTRRDLKNIHRRAVKEKIPPKNYTKSTNRSLWFTKHGSVRSQFEMLILLTEEHTLRSMLVKRV